MIYQGQIFALAFLVGIPNNYLMVNRLVFWVVRVAIKSDWDLLSALTDSSSDFKVVIWDLRLVFEASRVDTEWFRDEFSLSRV